MRLSRTERMAAGGLGWQLFARLMVWATRNNH